MSSENLQIPGKSKPFKQGLTKPTHPAGILFNTQQIPWMPFLLIGLLLSLVIAVAINYAKTSPILIVLGGMLGLILAVIILQKPEIGAYLIIFTVFTNLSDLFTEKGLPSINKPLIVIITLGIFANFILRTGKLSPAPKFTRHETLLLVYFLVVIASSFVAVNQSKSMNSILDLAKDIAVGICIYITLNTKEKWKSGVNVLLFAVTLTAILGIIQNLTGSAQTFWGLAQLSAFGQTDASGQLRYGGPIAESNIWGQVLVSILPIALYHIAKERTSLVRMLSVASAIFIFFAMLLTQSRGAFVALVVVLVLIAIDLRIKSTTLLAITIIGVLLLLFGPSKYTERIKTLDIFFQSNSNGLAQDESVQGRREKMLIGLAMFKENPFLGIGFANYTDNYWNYAGNLGLEASNTNVNSDTQRQPHSLYIEIMAETGVFGITSFLAFLGLLLYGLYRARIKINANEKKPDKDWPAWISSLMMSILTFLVAGFFLHGIGFRFIWVMVGLALAAIRLAPTPTYSIKRK